MCRQNHMQNVSSNVGKHSFLCIRFEPWILSNTDCNFYCVFGFLGITMDLGLQLLKFNPVNAWQAMIYFRNNWQCMWCVFPHCKKHDCNQFICRECVQHKSGPETNFFKVLLYIGYWTEFFLVAYYLCYTYSFFFVQFWEEKRFLYLPICILFLDTLWI